MTTLPRLTEIGDTFTAVVNRCVPEGDKVWFTFIGYGDEKLTFSRINVDAKLMDMGFYDQPTRATQDGVIRYDDVSGESMTFSRVPPIRGTLPGWRIERTAGGVVSRVPKLAELEPPAPAPAPAPLARQASSGPPDAPPVTDRPAGRRVAPAEAPPVNVPERRETIHAAYLRELAWVIEHPAKLAKKNKVAFDVNAAVSTVLIEMAKRGCL